ncbi:MAG TPA: FAD-dependent oxidoreductase [Candidatus Limnocylindrales bacterium]
MALDRPTAQPEPDAAAGPSSGPARPEEAADAERAVSYWLRGPLPDRRPPLRGAITADVAIVGAGFTGLWTALHLTETDPSLRVVVLEQGIVGYGASGRNGGFVEASLTHGLANGLQHFPDEWRLLDEEGVRNLAELSAFIRREGIDCDLEETGLLTIADQPHQVDEFRDWAAFATAHGEPTEFLDRERAQEEVRSPRVLAALLEPPGRTALVDPARLVRGLARVAEDRGVTIHEGTRVTGLERRAGAVRVRAVGVDGRGGEDADATAGGGTWPTALAGEGRDGRQAGGLLARLRADGRQGGATAVSQVTAAHLVVATSAYSGWLRRLQPLFAPVYDYALVSDPLTPPQRAAIGWRGRQGLVDANNQFHYVRLTADDRILWGGYDAIHYRGDGVGPRFDRRPATFEKLERQFRETFPQLADVGFPYRWGGAIDTTSRFTAAIGTTMGGRVAYAIGYTGLGVGTSRWAAGLVRDLIMRPDSPLLRLRFVREAPFPFPPEPLRSLAIDLVRRELDRADRNAGRRGLILRALDAVGIGFDS